MAGGSVMGTCVFRGVEYIVTMTTEGSSRLVVEVENRLTADQWRGAFDATGIEDLTRKTGNYKQFPIFINMLETAITQSGESVTLDLLTFSDLETLRSRKSGVTTTIPEAPRNPSLNSKRYLILTYTVEFDRIHYPLPLPYVGKPDPRALQETTRDLHQQIKTLKHQGSQKFMQKEIDKWKREYDLLLQEKEELEAEFLEFRRQVQLTTVGSAAKEVRILKDVVKNLEEDLLKEKTKHQRATTRRSQENRELLEELDEVKASERRLQARVKSLTNELAIYKRRGTSSRTSTSGSNSRGRHTYSSSVQNGYSSRDSSLTRDNSRVSRLSANNKNRSLERSRESSLSKDRSRARDKPLFSRDRSSSRERCLRDRSSSRERSLSRNRNTSRDRARANLSGSSAGSTRSRGSSTLPPGGNYPRFDPTAYVKDKQEKKKETDKKIRRPPTRLSGGYVKKRQSNEGSIGRMSRSRNSSVSSLHSHRSSVDSMDSDFGLASDTSEGRLRKAKKVLKSVKQISAWSSPDSSFNTKTSKQLPTRTKTTKKILSSTPERSRTRSRLNTKSNMSDGGDSDYFDRSSEIGEIDARLNRLQEFMKHNL